MDKKDALATSDLQARYPLSAKYPIDWIIENQMGSHCLWLMETLCQTVDLRAGMRVLDMGCGKAISSIFLAREFGVRVWANDLWIGAGDNWQRICAAGLENQVFPMHADARQLPYAEDFFDAIVSINSVQFYGTDDGYLEQHLAKLVKPGGQIGIIVPGWQQELVGHVPESVAPDWGSGLHNWHSAAWWRWHWEKTGLVDIELADNLPEGEGFAIFLRWEEVVGDSYLCRRDGGQNVTFVRVVARRKLGKTDESA
jgi:SAM-dependent methyltransferase